MIRPLVYVPEDDIIRYASLAGFPVTCCACPSCGDPDMKRVQLKKLLVELEQRHPGIKASLLSALGRVDQRHLFTPSKPVTEPGGRNEAPKKILTSPDR